MARLTRIYTRGGDKGQTSLGDGQRLPKHDLRIEAYGTVDETNAVIGLARLYTTENESADSMLGRIQNDLFDLGGDLCVPEKAGRSGDLRIVSTQIDRLEREIDEMNEQLAPLANFILPGGTACAAHLHHARTVVRRAERLICLLAESEKINPLAIAYVNRLSDHFFVLARYMNERGAKDILWSPGATR